MKRIILFFIIISAGCNTSVTEKNKPENNIENQQTGEVEKPMVMPRSEFEITEGGIGVLHLGDNFDSLDFRFKNIDTLTISSEGIDWRVKRINLSNGEWILAEENHDDIVTRIHTNSAKYKTSKGTHVGQLLSEIVKSGENIGLDFNEGTMSIGLDDQNISISIDSLSEQIFYSTKNQELEDIPSTATVDEIGIF